jgi:DNA-directed RNA polymerase specialized sigma24 family protein
VESDRSRWPYCYGESYHGLMMWSGHDRDTESVGVPVAGHDCHPSIRGWARAAVLRAVDELKFELVEAMWLVDVCDLSYREAAAATRSTEAVFVRRLHHARRELQRLYPGSLGD